MIEIKLATNKRMEPLFYMKIDEKAYRNNNLFKRVLIESKRNRGYYNFNVPIRYFVPIFANVDKNDILLDKESLLSFLEFADYYEENIYYSVEANANYMKKWRNEKCPNIFRITIDQKKLTLHKEIVFKKIDPLGNGE